MLLPCETVRAAMGVSIVSDSMEPSIASQTLPQPLLQHSSSASQSKSSSHSFTQVPAVSSDTAVQLSARLLHRLKIWNICTMWSRYNTAKLLALCGWNPPVTDGFPSQRARITSVSVGQYCRSSVSDVGYTHITALKRIITGRTLF